MQLLMNSAAAAELRTSLRELFDLRNGAQGQALAGAQGSLSGVKDITTKVDFDAMQVVSHYWGTVLIRWCERYDCMWMRKQVGFTERSAHLLGTGPRSDSGPALQRDLDRVNNILVLVQELNAASQTVPPDIALIQTKAQAIEAETREVQGSIDRLQETAKVVSDSKEDILKVVSLSEDVQARVVKIEPLLAPMQDIFGVCTCVCARVCACVCVLARLVACAE